MTLKKPFECLDCHKRFKKEQGRDDHVRDVHLLGANYTTHEFGDEDSKDWGGQCCVCDASPCVAGTDLCGPCCFGEAETVGGNW